MDLEIVGVGTTAKIYHDGNVAIKLYNHCFVESVEEEARLQAMAAEFGLPVPKIFGVKQMGENQIALEMEYIAGTPLIDKEMDQEKILQKMSVLVKLQCDIHAKSASAFPKLNDRLTMKIKQNSLINDKVKNQILALLEQLNTGATQLCHGDFHPLNILFDGQKHWIIDWVDATAGCPSIDACRTYVLLRQFAPELSEIYLHLFCERSGISQKEILMWLPVIVTARLAEDVDVNGREMLLGILYEIIV